MTYTHRIKNGIRVDLTAEEITALENRDTQWNNGALDRALTELRRIRNNLLKETDWMALPDVTMSSDMASYRQALRDLPATADITKWDTDNWVWPTKPA